MTSRFLSFLLCACMAVASVSASGKLPFVASIFSSHMVLQRDCDDGTMWGWTTPGTTVSVTFAHPEIGNRTVQSAPARSSDGRWQCRVPRIAAGVNFSVLVWASSGAPKMQVTLDDVAFGDVFLCGGQSNMQFTVNMSFNGPTEVANANYPNIRLFSVLMNHSTVPSVDVVGNPGLYGTWQRTTPEFVGGAIWQYFSGACYFFGRDLHLKLGKAVPIGLLSSNYGGTIIEAWMDNATIAQCPNGTGSSFTSGPTEMQASSSSSSGSGNGTLPPTPTAPFCPASWQLSFVNQPMLTYNVMIAPILDFTIRGVFWWQGEQNSNNPVRYECLFPAMVQQWRRQWTYYRKSQGEVMPFVFVIMEPYVPGCYYELIRMAQMPVMALPRIAYSNGIDIGDVASPYMGPIHPRNKQLVGKRGAAAFLSIAYNETASLWKGPEAAVAKVVKATDSNVTLRVVFRTKSSVTLTVKDAPQCWDCCKYTLPFSVSFDPTGITPWTKVTAVQMTVSRSSITFVVPRLGGEMNDKLPSVVALSYESYPQCLVYDSNGLPAPPVILNVRP